MTDRTPEPVVRADALARADKAWSARVAGATWAQAAELAGYSDGPAACHGVSRVYGQLPKAQRTELRDLWRDRLETIYRQAVRDVLERRPGAVVAAVRVAQAAVALDGLAEPVRVDVDLRVEETFRAISEELVRHGL